MAVSTTGWGSPWLLTRYGPILTAFSNCMQDYWITKLSIQQKHGQTNMNSFTLIDAVKFCQNWKPIIVYFESTYHTMLYMNEVSKSNLCICICKSRSTIRKCQSLVYSLAAVISSFHTWNEPIQVMLVRWLEWSDGKTYITNIINNNVNYNANLFSWFQ